MNPSRKPVRRAIVGIWAVLAFSSTVIRQSDADAGPYNAPSIRSQWEQRVLRRSRPRRPGLSQTATMRRTSDPWSPIRPVGMSTPVEPDAGVPDPETLVPESNPLMEGVKTLPDDMELAPLPTLSDYYPPDTCDMSCDGCDAGCSACGPCGCDYAWGHYYYGPGQWWGRSRYWRRHFSFFAGVHGFKSPADRGQNGNFGFHEGLNWGAPIGGPLGLGYQLGVQAAHSNFSGDQAGGFVRGSGRDQIFFTGGIFHRAPCGGWQWGVVFDLLHDSFYGDADLGQIRTESALVLSGCREIGYSGAIGLDDDSFMFPQQGDSLLLMQPADTYCLFYRRHFSGGGQGRIWTGLSGDGEALLGADCTVPLGTSWALENNFTYLIPKEGSGSGGQTEETWCVSIQLVWYPGREARCVFSNPYHPLFSVADNSQFLLDER